MRNEGFCLQQQGRQPYSTDMSRDETAFVAEKHQDRQSLAAEKFPCPLCSKAFDADSKLWRHAKRRHQQEMGFTEARWRDERAEAELRKQFRHEMFEKQYVIRYRLSVSRGE